MFDKATKYYANALQALDKSYGSTENVQNPSQPKIGKLDARKRGDMETLRTLAITPTSTSFWIVLLRIFHKTGPGPLQWNQPGLQNLYQDIGKTWIFLFQ